MHPIRSISNPEHPGDQSSLKTWMPIGCALAAISFFSPLAAAATAGAMGGAAFLGRLAKRRLSSTISQEASQMSNSLSDRIVRQIFLDFSKIEALIEGVADEKERIEIAKQCARFDPLQTGTYIKKFNIRSEEGRLTVFNTCSENKIEKLFDLIPNFEFSESTRVQIAEVWVKKSIGVASFLNKIEKFDFKDEKNRIKVAKMCVVGDLSQLVNGIRLFNISSEEGRMKILKRCYQHKSSILSHISQFDLSEETRIEFAKFCAVRDPKGTVDAIEHFSISSEKARIKIAEICTVKNPSNLMHFIKLFNISSKKEIMNVFRRCYELEPTIAYRTNQFGLSEETRIEFAKFCAVRDPTRTAHAIECFSISSEETRIEIAELCIRRVLEEKKPLSEMMLYLCGFDIQNENARLNIARIYAEKDPICLAYFIDHLNITDERERIKLAQSCIQKIPISIFSKNFSNFDIQDKKARHQLTRICAEKDPVSTIENLVDFSFANEEERMDLASRCAQYSPETIARQIYKLNIFDEQFRIELAKTCAKKDGMSIFHAMPNFGIKDVQSIREITTLGAIENPKILDFLSPSFYEITQMKESGPWDQSKANDILANFIQKDLANCGFDWIIKHLRKISDPHTQEQHTIAIAAGLWILQRNLTKPQLDWLNRHQLLESAYSLRAPHFFLPVISEIISLCSDEQAVRRFEERQKDENESLSERLIGAFLAQTDSQQSALLGKIVKREKIWKEGPKTRLLLYVLRCIRNEPLLSQIEKEDVLKQLVQAPDFAAALRQLQIIFDLGEAVRLRYVKNHSLNILWQKSISSLSPLADSSYSEEKIRQTFSKSRKPEAIWQYTAKMKQTNDPRTVASAAAFIGSVADGTYLQKRYDLSQNPHLKRIGQHTVNSWKVGISLDSVQREKIQFDSFDWLHTKLIVDSHLDISKMNFLLDYLKKKTIWGKNLNPTFIEEALAKNPKDPILIFQRECIHLAHCMVLAQRESWPYEKLLAKQQEYLRSIQAAMKDLSNGSGLFRNDVAGQLKLLTPSSRIGTRAIDTDDPYDLLLCGVEVPGSCQHVAGDPHLTKGLLGYLLNGQTRLLAVTDAKGGLLARALLRILWDGEKPVLFLERHYGDPGYQKAIQDLAKKKADQMQLTLTQKSFSPVPDPTKAPKPLTSIGGVAPFEYCDGIAKQGVFGSGVAKDSQFTIQNVKVFYKPKLATGRR